MKVNVTESGEGAEGEADRIEDVDDVCDENASDD